MYDKKRNYIKNNNVKNFTTVLKIAPAFLLASTIIHAQTNDSVTKEKKIEEVVLIGYGKQKKSDLTGSITSISSKDFNGGATSADQLIQGKAPGVSITGNGGAPGAGSTIRIRGGASLNALNDPLYVIDGVPIDAGTINGAANPLALINPNDIESFDILKDASATAIYGNRASNGVIIITTKKGSTGPFRINFSTVASVSTKMGNVDVLDANEYRTYMKRIAQTNQTVNNYLSKLGSANTNWQDLIFQDAWGTDNNLSLSGGVKGLPYRLSLGYNDQNGILRTNSFRRSSLGLNLSPKFLDNHLSLNLNFKGTFTDNRFANAGAIGAAQYFDPTQPAYSADGSYMGYYEWMNNGSININATRNPLGLLYGKRDVSSVWRTLTNAQIDYKLHFLPDLHLNLNVGYDYTKSNGAVTNYAGYGSAVVNSKGGSWNEYTQEKKNKLLETYFNYTKDISSINTKVDITGGYSYQSFEYDTPPTIVYYTNGVPDDPTLAAAGKLVLLSFYGRGIITFNNKYILTGTIRRDGSSRFYNGSRDNLWGNFASGAFAWKIKEEGFLKNSSTVSDLKLRLGYGQTGQQDILGYYPSYANYTISQGASQYQFGSAFFPMYRPAIYNPNLVWETTNTANVGLDFGFVKNRIYGNVDVYQKNTKDLLATVPIPAGNFSNKNTLNVGKMEIKGIEASITFVPVKKENLTWDFNINATHYKSEVTDLGPNFPEGFAMRASSGNITGGTDQWILANSVGKPANSFYVYQQVYDASGKPIEGVYVDRNGDGIINDNDRYFYKSVNPDVSLGFNTKLNYKKWDFALSMRAVLGNYVYNNSASNSSVQSLASNEYLQNINSLSADYNFTAPQLYSDIFVENASFLRLDNVNVGYNFGEVFGAKSNLKVYALLQNVFVITKYKGVDPEIFGNVDNGFYQRPKVYSLGFNFQF
ncbi:SusC/RagA family TonB-linked outer membrane protein [Chryseobacterium taeanense]|uniref:SusC/RagA family TonB-linked outer membrane protein n=1 Tax=Chryseobacterium taeanense TaxID=311334 RepID=UPI0035B297C4